MNKLYLGLLVVVFGLTLSASVAQALTSSNYSGADSRTILTLDGVVGCMKGNCAVILPDTQVGNLNAGTVSSQTVNVGEVRTNKLCVGTGDDSCTFDGVFQGAFCGLYSLTIVPNTFPCRGKAIGPSLTSPGFFYCPVGYAPADLSGIARVWTCIKH